MGTQPNTKYKHLTEYFLQGFKSKIMAKLAIFFVALFVAAVAAETNNLLASFKSLENVKRAALNEQKKDADSIKPLMMMLDTDHDGMLNVDELKALMAMSGAPPSQMGMLLNMLMGFDKDNNKKLDINEMVAAGAVLGF